MIKKFIDAITARLTKYAIDLLKPTEVPLAPFSQQWAPARNRTIQLIGLIAVGVVGIMYGYYTVALPPAWRIFLMVPIGLMILLSIWLLPEHDNPPVNLMRRAFLGFIVVAMIWPDYLTITIPGLPWISARRLFLAPMILALAISASMSQTFRRNMREMFTNSPGMWRLLVAFTIIQIMSITLAVDHIEAVKNLANYIALWTCVMLVSVYLIDSNSKFDKILWMVFWGAITVGIIGIDEYYNHKAFWLGHIPSFLQIDPEMMELFTGSQYRYGLFRAKSTFTTPLSYAEFMAMASMITVYFAIRTKSTRNRVIFIALDLAILYANTLAQARLGNVGWIAGHTIFGLLWAVRRWRANNASLIGPAVAIAYPAMVIALFIGISSVSFLHNRVLGSAATEGSNEARKNQWRGGIPKAAKSPIFGYGPRQGAVVLNFKTGGFRTIDTYYLSILLDYGVLGFAFFYGMFGYCMFKCFKVLLHDEEEESDQAMLIISMLTVFLLTRSVLSQEDNNWLAFLLIGASVSLVARARAYQKPAIEAVPQRRGLAAAI